MGREISKTMRRAALMAGCALVLAPGMALAEMATDSISVSEVLVTGAQKRAVASVATKSDVPVLETPQSISVITADQLSARGAMSLQDALGYSSGVRSDAYGNDGRVDSFRARGDTPTQYLDGLRAFFSFYASAKVEPYTLERVEVVKGPSSVLYGQGAIAGVVNMVSKRPSFEAAGEASVSYGSHDRRQIQGDYTAPINDQLAFRIVGLMRFADSQVDYIKDDRYVIEPSLTWRPSDRTEITFLLRHQHDETGSTTQFLPWAGTIFSNPNGELDSSLFIGEPDWEKFNATQTEFSWFARHDVTDWLTFRHNFRYTRAEVDYQTVYGNSYTNPFNPWVQPGQARYVGPQRSLTRYLSGSYPRSDAYALDNQLQAKFTTGGLAHTLLGGVDAQNYEQELTQVAARLIEPIDFFNPVYGNYTRPGAPTKGNTTKQKQLGFYLQDQIKVGGFSVLLGLRHDKAESETITPLGVHTKKEDSKVTGRAGVLYTFANGLAPYLSYSESFVPVAGTNLAGKPFDPQVGKQWELGLKWQPKAGTLITAALYDLRDTNRVTTSPTNPLDRVQTGEVKATGFEIEGETVIADVWTVTAAYTYIDAEVSKSNNVLEVGKPLASTPEHTASVWGMRTFTFADDSALRVGLGARYAGESEDRNLALPLFTLKTPSHTLADLMVSYERDSWRAALNVNNLTDEYYLASCLTRGDCFIGARRTTVATIGYRF